MSCKTFCDELEELIERHFDNNEELLVVGDFNVWAEVENDRDVKRLFSVMSPYGLTVKGVGGVKFYLSFFLHFYICCRAIFPGFKKCSFVS